MASWLLGTKHRQALRQLDGALGHRFESWRARALELLAQTEAAIDFPDEELDILSEAALSDKIRALMNEYKGPKDKLVALNEMSIAMFGDSR